MCSDNPYAAPQTPGPMLAEPTEAEAIRKQYLKHEASVKSIGTLYMLGAILMIPGSLFMIVMSVAAVVSPDPDAMGAGVVMLVLSFIYLAIGILQGATAIGLRSLQPWARIVAAVLAAIGLLGFPIGTLISAYFLYLLLSQKGTMVFSPEYKRVVEQTPHIRYKTSIVVIILLLLLLVLFGAAITFAVLGG